MTPYTFDYLPVTEWNAQLILAPVGQRPQWEGKAATSRRTPKVDADSTDGLSSLPTAWTMIAAVDHALLSRTYRQGGHWAVPRGV
jgi:hypothetical protein